MLAPQASHCIRPCMLMFLISINYYYYVILYAYLYVINYTYFSHIFLGFGVFATKDFDKGSFIVEYKGELITGKK